MIFQKDYWERNQLGRLRPPTHPVIEEYVISKIEIIKEYIDLAPETTLLDVGCSNGVFTYYWDKICTVTGVDFSEKMLTLNPVTNTLLMDANDLKFADNSFDVVFCHSLLHHVEDIGLVIKEMARVSKRHVVILEPNRNNPLQFLLSYLKKTERKALKFSPSYLKRVSETNGLWVVDSFARGMITPDRMPPFLIPVVRRLNFKQPMGMTNFVIAEIERRKNSDIYDVPQELLNRRYSQH